MEVGLCGCQDLNGTGRCLVAFNRGRDEGCRWVLIMLNYAAKPVLCRGYATLQNVVGGLPCCSHDRKGSLLAGRDRLIRLLVLETRITSLFAEPEPIQEAALPQPPMADVSGWPMEDDGGLHDLVRLRLTPHSSRICSLGDAWRYLA